MAEKLDGGMLKTRLSRKLSEKLDDEVQHLTETEGFSGGRSGVNRRALVFYFNYVSREREAKKS